MTLDERAAIAWRKSSHTTQGNCVELGRLPAGAAVRDSKQPDGPVLTFAAVRWHTFLTDLRAT